MEAARKTAAPTPRPPDSKETEVQFMAEVLDQLPITLHSGAGAIELLKQRRRRQDNGKFGREFLSVKITAHRALFIDVAVAEQIHDALGQMLPRMKAATVQLDAERKQREEEWQARIATADKGTRPANNTGKTARKKAAGKAGKSAHLRHKQDKAAKEAERLGNKGGTKKPNK